MKDSPGSLGSLRQRNRLRIIDVLRRTGQRRAASTSSSATGLSRTTVSKLVAELQADGLVIERRERGRRRAATRGASVGRPPVALTLEPGRGRGHRHRLRPQPRARRGRRPERHVDRRGAARLRRRPRRPSTRSTSRRRMVDELLARGAPRPRAGPSASAWRVGADPARHASAGRRSCPAGRRSRPSGARAAARPTGHDGQRRQPRRARRGPPRRRAAARATSST